MTELTSELLAGLDLALNEATVIGVELDVTTRRFAATLGVLSLPEDDGPPRPDPRISLVLEQVGRLAVSWRHARWDDALAEAVPMALEELPSVVAGFGQLPIYGWKFFDAGEEAFSRGSSQLSLNIELGPERTHTFDLFQDTSEDFIELRVWFDSLVIRRLIGHQLAVVSVDEVADGGKRWWDALYAGDPRTAESGIMPLKE
jgi:hypothetical protein